MNGNNRMRVLILSHYCDPEPIPKPMEMAQELIGRGHTATILTGFPNYPSGKIHKGYRLGIVKHEVTNGVPITRSFMFPYHGRRVFGRLLNYASFMISAVLGSFFTPPCDVIYVWHPPLTIGVAAWLIGRLRRVPFVYDVQDIWPESAVLSGILKEGRLVRLMHYLERFVYRKAHHILVVTDGAYKNLISKGVAPEKVSVMPHWVDESQFMKIDHSERDRIRQGYGWGDRFVVLFAGNIGMVQGLDTLLFATKELSNNGKFLFVLIGDGSDKERLKKISDTIDLKDRLQFIERQPANRMPNFMAASDALMVHLKRSELSRFVIPTKTLSYLAAGKPILLAMDGAAAQLVTEAGAGLVVPPENPADLARAVQTLAEMPASQRNEMGKKGREYALSHLSKPKVIPLYEAILRRAVMNHKS
jgi:colanic acid biosynthesis glycosyl transferase WcaI